MVETSDALSPAMDTNQLVQGFFVTLATAKKNSSGIANSKRTNGSNKSSGELESSSIPNYFTGGVFCDSELDEETKKSWIGAFKVVFLSPCGSLNLASRISQGAIEELVQEAVKSSEVLEQAGRNAFVEVFLTDLPRAVRYDLHMQVEISPTSSLKDVKDIASETRIGRGDLLDYENRYERSRGRSEVREYWNISVQRKQDMDWGPIKSRKWFESNRCWTTNR